MINLANYFETVVIINTNLSREIYLHFILQFGLQNMQFFDIPYKYFYITYYYYYYFNEEYTYK